MVINGNFLQSRVGGLHLPVPDNLLPIRLQKRQILEQLGFPIDHFLKAECIAERRKIKFFVQQFLSEKESFFILISEKLMSTHIPPLFSWDGKKMSYRGGDGSTKEIPIEDLFVILDSYPSDTWVEFAKPVWKETTIVGRLIYDDSRRQTLELQTAVTPSGMGCPDANPYFFWELAYFYCDDFLASARFLWVRGYTVLNRFCVSDIAWTLKSYENAFQKLREIASLPVLEFAYLGFHNMIAIDIDWPDQWVSGPKRRD